MNPWQMAQQIVRLLKDVAWTDGSAEVVFGEAAVFGFSGAPAPNAIPPGFPFALVTLDGGEADPDHPGFLTQSFGVTVVVMEAGDRLGEQALLGGPRPDLGSSQGAGLLEVMERAQAALQALTGADGAHMQLSSVTTDGSSVMDTARHIAYGKMVLQAMCTSAPAYSAPQQLAVSGSTWSWSGAHCEARFDFMRYRLGYATGSTPPATPDDCDGIVYTGTAAAASHVSVSGRTYAVFADYSPRSTGTVAGSSRGDVVGAYLAT